jgi:hypothetical protein
LDCTAIQLIGQRVPDANGKRGTLQAVFIIAGVDGLGWTAYGITQYAEKTGAKDTEKSWRNPWSLICPRQGPQCYPSKPGKYQPSSHAVES